MASKQKQSVSFTHFGFTSKKVALRDEEEAPNDNAVAASTVGPLTTRTEDPLPPSDSPEEQRLVEAEMPDGWSTKQVGAWKGCNCLR